METNYIEKVGPFFFVGVSGAESEEVATEYAQAVMPGYTLNFVDDNGDRSFEFRFTKE